MVTFAAMGPMVWPVFVLAVATLLMLRVTQHTSWQQEYAADDYATDLVSGTGLTWLITEPPVHRVTRRITTHPDSHTRHARQHTRAPQAGA